jgi:hypothetical protein
LHISESAAIGDYLLLILHVQRLRTEQDLAEDADAGRTFLALGINAQIRLILGSRSR